MMKSGSMNSRGDEKFRAATQFLDRVERTSAAGGKGKIPVAPAPKEPAASAKKAPAKRKLAAKKKAAKE